MADLRQTENLFIELSGEGATDLICIGARVRERFSTIPEMRMEFTVKITNFDPKTILGKADHPEDQAGLPVVRHRDLGRGCRA